MKETTKLPKMTEAAFQKQVIALAKLHGWRVAHFRPSLNRRGKWQTAVQADGSGFPDLVLVRERVIWAELKTEDGKLSNDQIDWQTDLLDANQEVYVWRPCNWEEIVEALSK